jgi:hypothetical protein
MVGTFYILNVVRVIAARMRDISKKTISLRIHFIGALTNALRQQTRQLEVIPVVFSPQPLSPRPSFYPFDNSYGPAFAATRHMTFLMLPVRKCCQLKGKATSGRGALSPP